MSLYLLIIFIQTIVICAWIYYVRVKNTEIPEFDVWLERMMQYNPDLNLEDALEEYINKYDVMVLQNEGEPEINAKARTKLQLIENYNVDTILQGNESYSGYKMSLQQSLKN